MLDYHRVTATSNKFRKNIKFNGEKAGRYAHDISNYNRHTTEDGDEV